jgi:alkylation response protein AidB-like acyl-CoA dehydrogenase
MPQYKAPLNEAFFLLNDVFGLKSLQSLPSFSDLSADLVEQILIQAAKLCEETLAPLNASGDRIGCVRDAEGRVVAPPNFKAAYHAFAEGGWVGLPVPEEYGGQGLPYTLSMLVDEFASSANMALAMYPGLTQGALAALLRHGTQQQKLLYAPKLAQGRWTGTMNLTEPQCGTDLGLLTTKALPRADGSFSITGQKIFISAGEHDLTENIIHLVLARIEGAPAGVKGISLFIVPKILVNENGELGARNTVSCGAIEEKMGIHGNATCVMNYDGAQGFLLG